MNGKMRKAEADLKKYKDKYINGKITKVEYHAALKQLFDITSQTERGVSHELCQYKLTLY